MKRKQKKNIKNNNFTDNRKELINQKNDIDIHSSGDSDANENDYEEHDGMDLDREELSELQYRTDESSSEDEVFGIHSSESSDDDALNDTDENEEINDSDLDKPEENLPNLKAWGKRKKNYYNSDHITKINSFQNEEDEETAKMEEEEARAIQKRLTAEIDDADMSFDLLSHILGRKEPEIDASTSNEVIEIDLSQMSELDKLKLLKKQSPELLTYISDFKEQLVRVKKELHPLLLKKDDVLNNSSAWNFIEIFYDTILTYCTNIVFYVLLRTLRTVVKSHPVVETLAYYKNMLNKMEPLYHELEPQINAILNGSKTVEVKSNVTKKKKCREKNQLMKESNNLCEIEVDNDLNDLDDTVFSNESTHSEEEEEEETDLHEKRGITYQIAKNKGLTPRRKKEMRNPRVKLRNKYRKAKIRRKGQVREVRKELTRYAGEISGINPYVSRSIKLKF